MPSIVVESALTRNARDISLSTNEQLTSPLLWTVHFSCGGAHTWHLIFARGSVEPEGKGYGMKIRAVRLYGPDTVPLQFPDRRKTLNETERCCKSDSKAEELFALL